LSAGPLWDLESLGYAEQLYRAWLQDERAVPPAWAALFEEQTQAPGPAAWPEGADRQGRVDSLLWAYRDVGYFYAHLNPLRGYRPDQNYLYPRARGAYEQLTLEAFGLSEAELQQEFSAGRYMGLGRATLREILDAFQQTYCSTLGVELLHIQNKPIRNWLLRTMESCRNQPNLSEAQRRIILEDLIRAETFEQFLHRTFIGQKRFSLEGSEVLIPALHFLINSAAEAGIEEIVLGTTHRGRITILNQIMNEPAEEIYALFEDVQESWQYGGSGDVKYHLGYSTDHVHEDGSSVHLSLVANPSHVESVDPVAEGKARGEQSRPVRGGFIQGTKKVLPVILHGDAAFCGQGVVAEVLNLAQLRGYHTGGTVHIIVNNQIGFTTPSRNARSSFFPTDVAKMTSVPIFHVNGDDPEKVVYAVGLALRFRQKFGQDAVVDIVCFRRHGHNEGDEPSFTHPRMYRMIEAHPGVAHLYGESCARAGLSSEEEQERLRKGYTAQLRQALKSSRDNPPSPSKPPFQGEEWRGLESRYSFAPVRTAVQEAALQRIARVLTQVPEGFAIHPKLRRILEQKREELEQKGTLDWSFAEALAFGSLLLEGTPVRLSGQDSERGTFSQRHSAWWDTESPVPKPYLPLNHLSPEQASYQVYDSPLSEYSILGFEYGYSLSCPHTLVIWEAQFGDFSNGAQVIIDNFVAAAEAKWQRSSGLVLLLPHGYEGQGPEHSSAHLERFLQLCAEQNMEVCNPTTPAQYFHLLRRQMKRKFRKPLVVMSPKSLLRHPDAVSRLGELTQGSFQTVLGEQGAPSEAGRVVLCSGKVYYDLLKRRRELPDSDTAILRVEQLYPFPVEALREALQRFRNAESFLWVQEEPENCGALPSIRAELQAELGEYRFGYVSRPRRASPAVGSHRQHEAEQRQIVEQAIPGPGRERARATEPAGAKRKR
jgi:2-oxoglutarate dehydrogenase E1 component